MLFSKNTSDFNKAYQVVAHNFENLSQERVEVFSTGFDHAVLVVDGTHAFRFPKNTEYLKKLKITTVFLQEFAPLSPIRSSTTT